MNISKYQCEICNYGSDNLSNFTRHSNSKLHLKRVYGKEHMVTNITCPYCNTEFSKQNNLNRHLKVCAAKDSALYKIESEKEIELLRRDLEKYMEINEQLKKDVEYFKGLVDGAGKIVDKSLNSITYANVHLNRAPELKSIKDVKHLTITHDDEHLLARIILNIYDKPVFIHFTVLIILRLIYRIDPRQRSFWSTDSARNNFIVRELVNGRLEWVHDKGGVKIVLMIIDPLLEAMRTKVATYIDEKLVEAHIRVKLGLDYNDDELSKGPYFAGKIFSKKFEKKILNKLKTHFYLDQNKILKCIKQCDLKKIDEDIAQCPKIIAMLERIENGYSKKMQAIEDKRYMTKLEKDVDSLMNIYKSGGVDSESSDDSDSMGDMDELSE